MIWSLITICRFILQQLQQKLEQSIKAEPSIDKPEDEDDEDSREEERRATGRSIAIVVFLSLMCLALYHVIEKKTTVLAGVSSTTATCVEWNSML